MSIGDVYIQYVGEVALKKIRNVKRIIPHSGLLNIRQEREGFLILEHEDWSESYHNLKHIVVIYVKTLKIPVKEEGETPNGS